MTHELKIQKQWADAKLAGEKPFEIRINDRGFQKGDIVNYRVIDPKSGLEWRDEADEPHSLERCDFIITYVIEGKDGLEKGYCVYADQPVPKRALAPSGGAPLPSSRLCLKDHTVSCGHQCGSSIPYACSLAPGVKCPVSADLGSGATPSNGAAEPLAPPAPLAEPSETEVRADGDIIPRKVPECKHFSPKAGDASKCVHAVAPERGNGLRCSCLRSPCHLSACMRSALP